MWNDPIVEETRRVRDELAARFDYDVKQLGQYYISQQQSEGRKIVRRAPKRTEEDSNDAA